MAELQSRGTMFASFAIEEHRFVWMLAIMGIIFWPARLVGHGLRVFYRKAWIEYGDEERNKTPRTSYLFLFTFMAGFMGHIFGGSHAMTKRYLWPHVIAIQLNLIALIIFSCQRTLTSARAKFRWNLRGLGLCLLICFLFGMFCVCLWVFELIFTPIPYRVLGEDCATSTRGGCGEAIAIAAAALVLFSYVPLAMETYWHQGRCVSMHWLTMMYGICGAFALWLSLWLWDSSEKAGSLFFFLPAVAELCLFISHVIWRYRTWADHKRAADLNTDFDSYADGAVEGAAASGVPFKFAASRKWRPAERQQTTPQTRARARGRARAQAQESQFGFQEDQGIPLQPLPPRPARTRTGHHETPSRDNDRLPLPTTLPRPVSALEIV